MDSNHSSAEQTLFHRRRIYSPVGAQPPFKTGSDSRARTYAYRSQSPVPYQLGYIAKNKKPLESINGAFLKNLLCKRNPKENLVENTGIGTSGSAISFCAS